MKIQLVVVKPFSGFVRGDVVTDTVRVQQILRCEQSAHVVRIAASATKED